MSSGSNLPPRGGKHRRCRGNLRPAPVFLSVETIAKVVALAFPRAPALENREITRFDTTVKPSLNDNFESTTAHPFTSRYAPGSNQGPAAAVTSGGAAGGCVLTPANVGQAQAGAGLGPHRPSIQASRVRVQLHRGETPPACVIRAAAQALGVAIRPARGIAISEGQRFLKAYEAKARYQAQGEREQVAAPEIKRAPSREECPRCGIPGFKGCSHFLPCEVLPPFPPQAEESDRRKFRFTGKRRGIGAMPI